MRHARVHLPRRSPRRAENARRVVRVAPAQPTASLDEDPYEGEADGQPRSDHGVVRAEVGVARQRCRAGNKSQNMSLKVPAAAPAPQYPCSLSSLPGREFSENAASSRTDPESVILRKRRS
jgi:hypothetical protein